jgi:hypothetical protein
MIFSEAEAQAKWCPFARPDGPTPEQGVYNRGCRCLASRCPQWRWAEPRQKPDRRGFCGLSGKPAYVD